MNFLPKKPSKKPIAASALAFFAVASLALAGSLTPPGAPAPTMNTLAELYDSIVGGFDSSGVVADQNGSLIEHLKYIEANMPAGSGWTDDGTVVRLTTITDNVGIGTTTPNNRLQVAGLISFDDALLSTALGSQALSSGTTGLGNTAIGYSALLSNTTGIFNTANGAYALTANTTGTYNTTTGAAALQSNTTGFANTANGALALASNTTGNENVANGFSALSTNTTGNENVANGAFALISNTTGFSNTANGASALQSNTTGDSNTADGYQALRLNTTGIYNTANGVFALYSNTTGSYNTANSEQALFSNTTGYSNTAVGGSALYSNTTGSFNIAIGNNSMVGNTTGLENVAMGNAALGSTTGNMNVAIGHQALSGVTAGSNNTAIGFAAGQLTQGSGNAFLGYYAGASEHGSNTLWIENADVASSSALIYGEFDTDYLSFGADVSVSGNFELSGFVASNLTPRTTDTFDLGTSALRWRDLYLASGSLHIGVSGDEAVVDYDVASDYLAFKPDGTNTRMAIKDGGNVGIGTTSPIAQLHVPGKVPTGTAGSLTLNHTSAFSNYVQGRYAYIGSVGGGVQIVDVSDPTAPASRSQLSISGVRAVYVQGNYLYTAQGFGDNRLGIYDVSNIMAPVLVGFIANADQRYVVVEGRYAYTLDTSGALHVYDVANPAAPTQVGTVTTGLAAGNAGMYVIGKYVYTNDATSGRLRIFNVANPAAPYQVSSTTITGGGRPGIYVQGRYAYVNSNTPALRIFDISNPSTPTEVGSVALGAGTENVFVQGRYAYVTNFTAATLQFIDVSNPAAPVTVGTVPTSASAYALYVQGRYAYVTNFNAVAKLETFDLGGSYIQQFETGGLETGTLTTSNNAFVGNDLDVRGGLFVARGANITGPFSVTSSVSGYTAFTINPDGSASVSGTLETGGMVINGHLRPGANDTYDLGSSTLRWHDLYLASGSLHIGASGNEAVIDYQLTSNSLAFKPDGTNTRMVIQDAGNVGIGTSTPAGRLTVKNTGQGFPATSGSTQSAGLIARLLDTSNATLDIGGNGTSGFWLQATTPANLSLNQPLLLNPNGGNVGIGTTTPLAKLDIAAASGSSGLITYGGPTRALFHATAQGYIDYGSNVFTNLNTGSAGRGAALMAVSEDNSTIDFVANYGLGLSRSATGTRSLIGGVEGDAIHIGAGAVNRVDGVLGFARNGGVATVQQLASLYAYANVNDGGGTVVNNYGLRIEDQTGVGTNNYAIWTEGAAPSYFDGNVGIGAITPSVLLHVASTTFDGDIFRLQDSDGDCTFNPETGSLITTCPSDARLKKNVEDSGSALDYLAGFRIRDYTVIKSNERKTGVIAQELQQTHPELVSMTQSGLLAVQEVNPWVLLKAIQELDGKIEGLGAQGPVDFTSDSSFDGLFARIVSAFEDLLGIEFGQGRVKADKLCAGSVCINEQQLQQLLDAAGGNVPEPTDDPEPEVTDEPTPTPTLTPDSTPTPSPTPTPEPEQTVEPSPETTPEPEAPSEPAGPGTNENGSSDEPLE